MSVATPGTRLAAAFTAHASEQLPGLIPYTTAGYPRLHDTAAMLLAFERTGCLAAEVGLPFSDPLADGPTVQRSSQRALENGMTVSLALEQVAAARGAGLRIPLALMTYVNPILAHGVERFAADAVSAGADALMVPDLPDDEAGTLREAVHGAGLALVPLVAPTTTTARLAAACGHATGFVYCVGVTGITGARTAIAPEAFELLRRVRAATALPRALGFGLSRHEHLRALAGEAEAAVVGSALLDAVARQDGDPAGTAERFLHAMRTGEG